MIVRDNLLIWLVRESSDMHGAFALRSVFERLESSFLPKPGSAQVTGGREIRVTSWIDPKLLALIDKQKPTTSLEGDGLRVALLQDQDTTLSIYCRAPGEAGPS